MLTYTHHELIASFFSIYFSQNTIEESDSDCDLDNDTKIRIKALKEHVQHLESEVRVSIYIHYNTFQASLYIYTQQDTWRY